MNNQLALAVGLLFLIVGTVVTIGSTIGIIKAYQKEKKRLKQNREVWKPQNRK
jgi:hypothetical protein